MLKPQDANSPPPAQNARQAGARQRFRAGSAVRIPPQASARSRRALALRPPPGRGGARKPSTPLAAARGAAGAGRRGEVPRRGGAGRAARCDGEPIRVLDRHGFAALIGEGAVHQGLALEVEPLDPPDLDDVLRAARTDAARRYRRARSGQRSAQCRRDPARRGGSSARSASSSPRGARRRRAGRCRWAASGALDLVPLEIPAVNLARTIERLKAAGFWCCGLDERAPQLLAELELGPRVALVLKGPRATGCAAWCAKAAITSRGCRQRRKCRASTCRRRRRSRSMRCWEGAAASRTRSRRK